MKIQILDKEGGKKGEIETSIFDSEIRKDIIQKVIEVEKIKHPYSPYYLAGKQASAAGKIRHSRRKWKTAAGHGISRVPRKIFWRRGDRFNWEAATISGVKGGRRAHPPKVLAMINTKKINKKEKEKAFLGALALSSSIDEIKRKYKTLKDKKIEIKFPIVVDNEILKLKTKPFLEVLRKILGNLHGIAIQKKSIRAGKGKKRGRKYRKTAGLLFVISNKEKKEIQGIEIKEANSLRVSDLASNGARLTVYTENAIKELEKRLKSGGKSRGKSGGKNVKTNNK